MRIRWMALTMAVAAGIATPLDHGLRAQETQEPSSTDAIETASSETTQVKRVYRTGDGAYNCYPTEYSHRALDGLRNTTIGGEMAVLMGGRTEDPCWPGFPVGRFDPYGGWGYMILDGVEYPNPPSQAEVRAAWTASRVAEAEGRATITVDDAPVPPLGNGYGSSALTSQTLVLQVRPDGPTKPRMYDGIPIVERDRSWERSVTSDGRRVWRSTTIERSPSLGSVADRYREGSRAALRSVGASSQIRAQEGFSQRSIRSARTAPAPSSSATATPRAAPKSPRLGKKGVEN